MFLLGNLCHQSWHFRHCCYHGSHSLPVLSQQLYRVSCQLDTAHIQLTYCFEKLASMMIASSEIPCIFLQRCHPSCFSYPPSMPGPGRDTFWLPLLLPPCLAPIGNWLSGHAVIWCRAGGSRVMALGRVS